MASAVSTLDLARDLAVRVTDSGFMEISLQMEGYTAASRGQARDSFNYPEGSLQARAWVEGWDRKAAELPISMADLRQLEELAAELNASGLQLLAHMAQLMARRDARVMEVLSRSFPNPNPRSHT